MCLKNVVINTVIGLVLCYLLACVVEIEIKNVNPNPVYSNYNVITWWFGGGSNE